MTLDPVIRLRLSTMMFLEFFVWGAWFVTLGTYLAADLGASGSQIALAFLTQSLGAILAPFIVGLIADRFFAAQRILGVLHLFSAVMLFLAGRQGDFGAFFVFALLAMISFMPTLALANSISFRRLTSPERQFPAIRVFGTIGWIVAGLLIGWLGWEAGGALENTFVMAAIGSALLGVYAFTLPHTPPEPGQGRVTVRDVLGLDALALLKSRSYLVFFLASILICIPLAFYYNFTNLYLNEIGVQSAAAVQSLGQVSEALFLLVMPLMLRKLGVKWTLLIGMLAWALRYALFAFGDAGSLLWLVIIGLVLHGVCYDFFFVAGQIYTDRFAPKHVRSAAQGLISLATYGVGLLIGSLISGPIVDAFLAADGAHDWRTIWLIPAALAVGVALFFAALFRERETVEAAEVSQGA
ncbi:nucleoside permease [Brachybacterium paraconglomeratum]|uniref:nucleoside permease n=1 Tax=Brachybacterium paraconglomeratum TaxID=173362 RepID=UPI0021A5BA06|nr:nucleoside permease [Brachybacterium paraconglomeratum]MCT1910589.1 nucleoside permease [Brachybacterium paraconglomeratum]